jgi:hypothetical protein
MEIQQGSQLIAGVGASVRVRPSTIPLVITALGCRHVRELLPSDYRTPSTRNKSDNSLENE